MKDKYQVSRHFFELNLRKNKQRYVISISLLSTGEFKLKQVFATNLVGCSA